MGSNRAPDDADLPWPVARGELDDIETLELERDAAGRLAWKNMTPPGQASYRAWLPKRGRGMPTTPPPDDAADAWVDDPITSRFASEATSTVVRKPAQPEAPRAPALEDQVETSTEPTIGSEEATAAARPSLPPSRPPATTPMLQTTITAPVGQHTSTSMPSWPTADATPLRLSLAIAPSGGQRPVRMSLPPIAGQTRTRVERLALLGTGALIGVMASVAFSVAWRPDGRPAPVAAERPSPAPPPMVTAPLATPAVAGPQLATGDVPAAPQAATDVTPVPASPPVQVAAAVAPSRRAVPPARHPTRASVATVTTSRQAAAPAPSAAPPEVLATVGRFAAAYNRMDASATQAVWPTADHQALVTTFTALREQRLTLSRCGGAMNGDTATVLCRGTLRYRPRVGNHDTQIVEGTWRFTMLQRANDWVVENVEAP